MEDLNFTYIVKDNEVTIYHHGRKATTLRGDKARQFTEEADSASFGDMQQLMARLTGNYKRGNEKHAKKIRREKYGY
ncbi:conserved hypothetical protein [Hahella chejuensis KCTC 2396]|uniref:Uncharacterized protein n=1 Tax=Hahella chejuensis (strain KCTC 2396) TaxID=349521 RepID=Q2SI02_HAHCH|nr:hypothetical protein [Hahella chejuensis]ABC29722.1 conserved hypothetical protein [Hahella chejuensis KCTC 2396]